MKYKRLLILIIVILVIWNVILSVAISKENTYHSSVLNTEIISNVVNGYSTDLTRVVDACKSSSVTVQSEKTLLSGFIYKKESDKIYIITSYHGVADSNQLDVIFASGYKANSELIGYDYYLDLAVLQVEGDMEVNPVILGDCSLLKAGEFVINIGTPSHVELSQSVSLCLVSHPSRIVSNIIKVDDTNIDYFLRTIQLTGDVSNGYSGAGVFNMSGEVMGMINMSTSNREVFAIGSNEMKIVADNIISKTDYERLPLNMRGTFISSMEVYERNNLAIPLEITEGFYVSDLKMDSVLMPLGIRTGDILISINDVEIKDEDAILELTYSKPDSLNVTYYRNGELFSSQG